MLFNIILLIQIIFLLLNLVESKHDYYVIKIQEVNNSFNYSSYWHKWSFIYSLINVIGLYVLITYILYYYGNYNSKVVLLLFPSLLFNRQLFFEIPLNLWRNLDWYYLGRTSYIDIKKRKYLGEQANVYLTIFSFLSLILINILIYKWQ
jgi:hypothetical protein